MEELLVILLFFGFWLVYVILKGIVDFGNETKKGWLNAIAKWMREREQKKHAELSRFVQVDIPENSRVDLALNVYDRADVSDFRASLSVVAQEVATNL